jgi:hypothetical protein
VSGIGCEDVEVGPCSNLDIAFYLPYRMYDQIVNRRANWQNNRSVEATLSRREEMFVQFGRVNPEVATAEHGLPRGVRSERL